MSYSTKVVAWADSFGVWHVRVPESPEPFLMASEHLRYELLQREDNVPDAVWKYPVRVPELDLLGTIVYRERFIEEVN